MMRMDVEARYMMSRPTEERLAAGALKSYDKAAYYRLLFVRGAHHLHIGHRDVDSYSAEPMIYLVPHDEPICLQAGACELELVELSFVAQTSLCGALCPQQRSRARSRTRETGEGSTQYRPRRVGGYSVGRLALNTELNLWLEGLRTLMSYPDTAYRYYDNRLEELFFLVGQTGGPEGEEFLLHYHCRISGFRERITQSYRYDMEVSELCALASAFQMNETAFKRTFYEEFGLSPREWLMERRAREIYHALITTDKNLKELSIDYGFCSVSYFGAFCRQMLGDTPRRLRQRVKG